MASYLPIPSKFPDSELEPNNTNPTYDAFGRKRVSEPQTLFYSSFQYGISDLVFNTDLVGTGAVSHDVNSSSVQMTTAADADSAILQSIQYHRYQPGKSQLVKITGSFGAPQTGVTKRAGYYDATDGFFFQQAGDGTYSITKRSSSSGAVVNTTVNQVDWNIGSMPGFDFTKAFIFFTDIEWLGVGGVRCGFVQEGVFTYVHSFHHAGITTLPYMLHGTLPVRWEMVQSGAGSGSMNCICAAVDSEGGTSNELGTPVVAGNDVLPIAVSGETVIMALRPQVLFQGVTNRRTVIIEEIGGIGFTAPVHCKAYVATGVTGGSWSAVDADHSSMDINLTASGFTGEHEIAAFNLTAAAVNRTGPASGTVGFSSLLAIGLNIAGDAPASYVVITAEEYSGSPTMSALVRWKEL